MYVSVLPVGVYVCHIHAWYLQRSADATGSQGTEVTDGCEPLVWGGEPNLSPLEDQPVPLASPQSFYGSHTPTHLRSSPIPTHPPSCS